MPIKPLRDYAAPWEAVHAVRELQDTVNQLLTILIELKPEWPSLARAARELRDGPQAQAPPNPEGAFPILDYIDAAGMRSTDKK